jgi:REP element-mobilizing transposase RayT
MPRSPRLFEPGSIIHVAARGALAAPIFRDDSDRRRFLTLMASAARHHKWGILAYCLMSNHYHLLVEVPTPTLSKGMQLINGQYASIFNDRHAKSGCLFQGRFWSGIVESERYLHAVVRYIGLNPVKAGLCSTAEDWRWGGHRELAAFDPPRFVDVERTLVLLADQERVDHGVYRRLFEVSPDPLVELSIRRGSELAWDAVKEEVVRLRRAGHPDAELARAVGRDVRTIKRWAADAHG